MSAVRKLCLLSAVVGALSQTPVALAQSMPSKAFLCCNLWLSSANWADDSNRHNPASRPLAAGTPVIPLTYADNQLKFEANGLQYTFANYNSLNLPPDQFLERWIVTSDPRRRLSSYPAVVQKEIRAGRVMRGMTRTQVAMAIGYPTGTNAPQLDTAEWKYMPYSGYEFLVLFDDRGRVRGVQSEDANTRAAMYSPTPVPGGGAAAGSAGGPGQ